MTNDKFDSALSANLGFDVSELAALDTAKDQVIRLSDGFHAFVNGKLYGPWNERGYAEAGLKIEQRRQAKRIDEAKPDAEWTESISK